MEQNKKKKLYRKLSEIKGDLYEWPINCKNNKNYAVIKLDMQN